MHDFHYLNLIMRFNFNPLGSTASSFQHDIKDVQSSAEIIIMVEIFFKFLMIPKGI